MEMRAAGDVAMGQDLTPPLYPLAFVLQDTAVASRCSACFSHLPPNPFLPLHPSSPQNYSHVPNNTHAPLYCSRHCSSLDSSLHFCSAEAHLFRHSSPPSATWDDFSDLRLSLRLLHILQHEEKKNSFRNGAILERISGLMTNREGLMFGEHIERIKEGAKLLATARRMCVDGLVDLEIVEESSLLEEMVLCLVVTNAVEVQDNSGCRIGVAVYGPSFSWINHSCSPNACYRFSFGQEHGMQHQQAVLITPAARGSGSGNGIGSVHVQKDGNGYGPRVVVRSIKSVRKGGEVTIAYTDLLQPKEMRQAELWLKYRFRCSCHRCCAVPSTYVDSVLQAPSLASIDCPASPDNALEEVFDSIDIVITNYLSTGDPKPCCVKLENLLTHGHLTDEPVQLKEAKSPQQLRLNPFHYISQNAYTTLASAHKVLAIDMMAPSYVSEREKLKATLDTYKTSAAYALLLAGVVHHLFLSESALVVPVVNFFTNAGELLLSLAGSSLWDSVWKLKPMDQELSSFLNCNRCCQSSELNLAMLDRNLSPEEVNTRLFNCIAEITWKVWGTLAAESSFLKLIQNPVDFSWLLISPESNRTTDFAAEEYDADEFRMYLNILGLHCLRHGSYLSSICYGSTVERK